MHFRLLFLFSLAIATSSLVGAQQQETGDAFCSELVCCSAVKSSTNVTYTLTRPPASQSSKPGFGWIAIGFGSGMVNSPMVIAWPNADNSVTLSQREATAHIQPSERTPSSVATLDTARTTVSSSASSITFSIPDTSAPSTVNMIWAYSETNPGSSASSANLVQHLDAGTASLDLTKPLAASSPSQSGSAGLPSATQPAGGGSSSRKGKPYTRVQKVLIAHAAFGGLGTMVMVPLGVVIARLLRLFYPRWVRAHYLIHVVLALPFITIAFALGVHATNLTGGPSAQHFFSSHRKLGLALFILMLFQIAYGTIMHVYPSPPGSRLVVKGKPIQNWIHPFIGVTILAIGWTTAWVGFDEWAVWTGLGPVPRGTRIAWGVLLGLFALGYLGGLALLPRQFREMRERTVSNNVETKKDLYPDASIRLREQVGMNSDESSAGSEEAGLGRRT